MPRVRWGINASQVDDFDRASQFAPYKGPIPPNAVYQWRIKQLKSVAGSRDKYPQLRVGLELVPRKNRDEERYAGYFCMAFLPITEKTAFRYVPFLDAIGVSGREFADGTVVDEEGNVKKIGRWRNTGDVTILGQLIEQPDQDGGMRKQIGWMGAPDGDEFDDDSDADDDDFADDEEEEAPPPRRSARSRAREIDDDEDPF